MIGCPLTPQHISAGVCPLKEFSLDEFSEYPFAQMNVDVEQPTRLRERQGHTPHLAKLGANAAEDFVARRLITAVVRIAGAKVH